MDEERIDQLQSKFAEAYAWRADASDIDWKEMGYGKKLAYLSWAVAWRKFKEIYPDANYRLIETVEGSPLWNVNGFGMLKCAVSACGIEHVENFPVMDNKNASIAIDKIDGRDVNDSMQRGLTKAIARFGVGLYIFEGKVNEPAPKQAPRQAPKPQPKPQEKPAEDPTAPLNESGKKYINDLLAKVGITIETFIEQNEFDPYVSRGNAKRAIALLKPLLGKGGNE